MRPCPGCGQAIDPTKAVYSKQGELVCKACESAVVIDEGYLRAARSSCYAALSTGICGLFFNWYFFFSIAAIIQAVRAIALVNRPEYRAALKNKHGMMLAAAIVGLVTGLVPPGLFGIGLLAGAVGGAP